MRLCSRNPHLIRPALPSSLRTSPPSSSQRADSARPTDPPRCSSAATPTTPWLSPPSETGRSAPRTTPGSRSPTRASSRAASCVHPCVLPIPRLLPAALAFRPPKAERYPPLRTPPPIPPASGSPPWATPTSSAPSTSSGQTGRPSSPAAATPSPRRTRRCARPWRKGWSPSCSARRRPGRRGRRSRYC